MQTRRDDLDGLQRLQDTHQTDNGPQNPALTAAHDTLWRRRLWEDAPVAGRCLWGGGGGGGRHDTLWCGRAVEHDELAVCPEGGSRDEGFLEEDADVGDEVPRGGVVGAVEDEIVLGHDLLGVLGFRRLDNIPVHDAQSAYSSAGDAPTAPSKRKPLRLKAAERLANPLAPRKVHRPEAAVDDSFIQSKRDKQLIKHSSFVSKITKAPTPTSKKNQKRREKKKLQTNLESLADALPELTAEEIATGEAEVSGKIRHKSLRSKPGALRRKERVVKGEMERFSMSLAQLSSVQEVPVVPAAAGAGAGAERMMEDGGADENKAPVQSTANRFAALRGFIAATMDQNPAFASQHRAIGGNGVKGA
ncbi:hypothetical protein VMCG_07807 [Cytospora schulzeri]|uniref:Ribosome biogenesis protein SLX9 n=1 Tax=Cytospora schulzeri TaxID=448051 RepID=A0A423VZX9_9PEZI|nr:hypothetical protein VMCG_07807 [Valsa malicola]